MKILYRVSMMVTGTVVIESHNDDTVSLDLVPGSHPGIHSAGQALDSKFEVPDQETRQLIALLADQFILNAVNDKLAQNILESKKVERALVPQSEPEGGAKA